MPVPALARTTAATFDAPHHAERRDQRGHDLPLESGTKGVNSSEAVADTLGMAKVSAASVAPQNRVPAEPVREPPAEPHLRKVLESLPAAVVRLAADGTFLAVNQQGLAILGGTSLEQILGSSLFKLVVEDERENCKSLLAQAITGQPFVLEVDVVGLTGTRQTVELRAIAYPAAPDGPSALIALRDVSDARRLAQSLVEAVAAQNEQSQVHTAERSRLLADLEQARQSHQAASDTQLAELERRLSQAKDERAALQTAHQGEIARLQETLADAQRRSAAETGSVTARLDDAAKQLAAWKSQCEALGSERARLIEDSNRLRTDADASKRTAAALTEQLAALDGEKQQALAEVDALRRTAEEQRSQAAELASHVKSMKAELANVREAGLAEVAAVRAASETTLRTLEARYTNDTDALRNGLNEAIEEQARLEQTVARADDEAARAKERIETLERRMNERDAEYANRMSELESSHRAQVAEIARAHAAQRQEIDASNGARLQEVEGAAAARLREAEAAGAMRLREAEDAIARATARADQAEAAIQRTEDERRQLQEAATAATEAEQGANRALEAEVASRTVAERARHELLKAIGQLAQDANRYGATASNAPANDAGYDDAQAPAETPAATETEAPPVAPAEPQEAPNKVRRRRWMMRGD